MNEISWHLIKLDIFNAFQRACKESQEKAVDSFEDGRLKYEWDILKESYFLKKNQTVANICKACALNLTSDYEGCQNKIPNLAPFKILIKENDPESLLLKYEFTDDAFDYWQTRELLESAEKTKKILQKTTWPVAQIIYQDSALNQEKGSLIYPWDGTSEEQLPYGNDGYRFGVSGTGIIVRRNYANILPQKFARLWWKDNQVFGTTQDDETIIFEPFGNLLPTWGLKDDYRGSELIFNSISCEIFFKETIKLLIDYLSCAQKNGTGVNISQIE